MTFLIDKNHSIGCGFLVVRLLMTPLIILSY